MTPEQQSALEALRGEPLTAEQIAELDPLVAARNDAAIAAVLSVGRKRFRQPSYIGEGTIADTIGLPAGPIFIDELITAAGAPLPAEPTYQDRANAAMIRQAWRLLSAGKLDVGLPSVRAGIRSMVGVLPLSAEDAEKICALAAEDDPVSTSRVSEVLNNA